MFYIHDNFTLDLALDTFYFGLYELISANVDVFIFDFQSLINKMIILDDEIESFRRKRIIKSECIMVDRSTFPEAKKSIPDYEYISLQIEGARIDIGEQLWMVDHPLFRKKLVELDSLLGKLTNDVELANNLVNDVNDLQRNIGLNKDKLFSLVMEFKPSFSSLIEKLRHPQQKHLPFQFDPANKVLPIPQGGEYRKGTRTISTFETRSKAPLFAQGHGRNFDRSKLPSQRIRTI